MERILVVDDEREVCSDIKTFFLGKGFGVEEAFDGMEALEKYSIFKPEVVLLDIKMPKMNGLDALKKMKEISSETEVIMTTAIDDTKIAVSCLQFGAFGYHLKPVNLEGLYYEVVKAIKHRKIILENKDYQENLERKVEERTEEVQALNEKLKDSLLEFVRVCLSMLENYDPFLGSHSKRVAFLCGEIGKVLKSSKKRLFDLEIAALLHDIGTVAIPKHLMEAPFFSLSEDKISLIKQHPVFAQNILIASKELERAGIIIKHHLEHMDGTGFPDSLFDKKIPLSSKILGVANAYDELKSRRRFTREIFSKKKEAEEFALNFINKYEGQYYKSYIIKALEKALENIKTRFKNKVSVSPLELKPGMVVASNIYKSDRKLLLAKDHSLNVIHIIKMRALYEIGLMDKQIFVYRKPSQEEKKN